MKRLTWILSAAVVGGVGLLGALQTHPAAAVAAPREPARRPAEAGTELRRYGRLLIRPVSVLAVIKSNGRDDFAVRVYYETPAQEMHVVLLDDAAASKLLWRDLAGWAARAPEDAGLIQAGELALFRAGPMVAAWAVENRDGSGAVAEINVDFGSGVAQLQADDQTYSRDQIRSCWEAIASVGAEVRMPAE